MPTFDPDEIRRMLVAIYQAVGVPDDAARTVAEHQVDANLAGHDSHGVIRTPGYIDLIERGVIVPDAPVEIVTDGPTTAVVDGHWGLGFVVTRHAIDLAVAKAQQHGVAAVTIRRQSHVGRLGAYSERAAEKEMIGLVTADSGRAPKSVVPFGGSAPRLGTNPLSIAVPAGDDGPIVLDIATSAVAGGKVRVAAQRGEPVPSGWIVDQNGRHTSDPNAYFRGGALLPLGADQGHKGYGLSFMVEVLAGLLTGIGFGVDPDGFHNDGVFIVAIDIARFQDPAEFRAEVSEFVASLKATPLADGHDEILYPGELERRTAREREHAGIAIDDRTWDGLLSLGRRLGVVDIPT